MKINGLHKHFDTNLNSEVYRRISWISWIDWIDGHWACTDMYREKCSVSMKENFSFTFLSFFFLLAIYFWFWVRIKEAGVDNRSVRGPRTVYTLNLTRCHAQKRRSSSRINLYIISILSSNKKKMMKEQENPVFGNPARSMYFLQSMPKWISIHQFNSKQWN